MDAGVFLLCYASVFSEQLYPYLRSTAKITLGVVSLGVR